MLSTKTGALLDVAWPPVGACLPQKETREEDEEEEEEEEEEAAEKHNEYEAVIAGAGG